MSDMFEKPIGVHDEAVDEEEALPEIPVSRIDNLKKLHRSRLKLLGAAGLVLLGMVIENNLENQDNHPAKQNRQITPAQLSLQQKEYYFNGEAEGRLEQLNNDLNATLIYGREGRGLGEVKVPVVVGTIDELTSRGWKPIVQDPIDIDYTGLPQTPILSHQLPYVSNLAVATGSIDYGGIKLESFAYTRSLRFVPSGGDAPRVELVSVYATEVRGNDQTQLELIAYDPASEKPIHDLEGKLITPGLPLGPD